jgi:hypothetical protein
MLGFPTVEDEFEAAQYSRTLERMIREGMPLTREKWISLNFLGRPPKPWMGEHEGEMLIPLRDFSKVDQ